MLDDLLVEYHQQPFWSTLPFEGEEYRGQFAYTWLRDHGIDPNWTFAELLTVARVPEPATAVLLAWGAVLVGRRARRP